MKKKADIFSNLIKKGKKFVQDKKSSVKNIDEWDFESGSDDDLVEIKHSS